MQSCFLGNQTFICNIVWNYFCLDKRYFLGLVYICQEIVELFGLEDTFKNILIQSLCNEQGHFQLYQVFRALSKVILNVSSYEACTTFLDNLFQSLTILIKKKFLPNISSERTIL